jgi:hypothetical protein
MLDRVISAVAVAQAIYVTLQAGIKLVEPHIAAVTPPPFEMEGPRILPCGETDDGLFALTEAFRCAVRLGLRSGPYRDINSFEVSMVQQEDRRRTETPEQPYRLSLTSCYHHHYHDSGGSSSSLSSSLLVKQ